MVESQSEMAKQAGQAASEFELQRTGRKPTSVNSVLMDDSVVITLGGALSPAEIEITKTPGGAAQVRELHRQLFLTSCDSLRLEMGVITGVAVWDATSELTTHTGDVVLFFLLAEKVAASTWTESASETIPSLLSDIWVAKQLAEVARQFEEHRTGRKPETVTAVLVDDSLVITLRGVLSSAEKEMAKTPVGAAQVREFHRQLFLTSCGSLRQEIETITGVAVREATSEVATHTGTVVLVFLLAASVAASTWSESMKSEPASRDPSSRNGESTSGGEG